MPSPRMTRRTLVAGLVALAVGLVLCLKTSQTEPGDWTSRAVDWDKRREKVKEVFISSWDAYSKYAWG